VIPRSRRSQQARHRLAPPSACSQFEQRPVCISVVGREDGLDVGHAVQQLPGRRTPGLLTEVANGQGMGGAVLRVGQRGAEAS